MAEKDRESSSPSKKKKLVIKKTGGTPSGSNIADVYQKAHRASDPPPSPARSSAPPRSGSGSASPRPPQNRESGGSAGRPPSQGQNRGPGDRPRSDQGQGRGGPPGNRPPQGRPPGGGGPRGNNQNRGPGGNQQGQRGGQQQRPPQQRSGGPPRGGMRNAGSVYINRDVPGADGSAGRFSGTPFDAVVETARKGGPQQRGKPATPARKPDPRERATRENINKFYTEIERKKQVRLSGTTVPASIEIMENIQVGELAKKLNLKPSDIISRLMKMGEMVTINHIIDADLAVRLAAEFNCKVKVVSLYDETLIEEEADAHEDRTNRPPVVTVMGHVDHGKTKLLDAIRNTNIIASEAGAITQHIGAYQATIPRGTITFLDTPGHEAFTAMRARGAAITDIVVLVVAADDGVKEQTLEAISHAREAGVPIIVAVNKIDLPAANPDRVKQQLADHGLQPEEWGGSTIYCPVSALKGEGIENLLEMILLQAEVLELKANSDLRGVGIVIEARVDPGKGPVATILVQKGSIEEGNPCIAGVYSGRIRAMFNDRHQRIKQAGPATPVEIIGIDGVPEAGDPFHIVESDKVGRDIASKRQHYRQITEAAERAQPALADLGSWVQDHKELKVIIKADVKGSVEAIREGLLKLSTDDVKVKVILGGTGAISETDVSLAAASNAILVAFNVRPSPRAQELATRDRVEINSYSIIYNVIEDIKKAMEGLLEPDRVENVLGRAEVRQIFKISRLGNIAGCMIISGKVRKNSKVRLLRGGKVIHEGSLSTLKRHKDDATEVSEGFECGISISGTNDVVEGDIIEAYEIKEVARKL